MKMKLAISDMTDEQKQSLEGKKLREIGFKKFDPGIVDYVWFWGHSESDYVFSYSVEDSLEREMRGREKLRVEVGEDLEIEVYVEFRGVKHYLFKDVEIEVDADEEVLNTTSIIEQDSMLERGLKSYKATKKVTPKILGYIVTDKTASVTFKTEDGVVTYQVPATNAHVVEALNCTDLCADKILELMQPQVKRLNGLGGNFRIDADVVYHKDFKLPDFMSVKLISMLDNAKSTTQLENFIENLMENPSSRAIHGLYQFLESGNFNLTPDGHFLAYKYVNSDYKDCHTGTFDNSVGSIVKMDRRLVDDNPKNTCSRGLHFCSYDYLPSYSQSKHIMMLKINPRDVVSIPDEYGFTKGRCCRYEVIADVTETHKKSNSCFITDQD